MSDISTQIKRNFVAEEFHFSSFSVHSALDLPISNYL